MSPQLKHEASGCGYGATSGASAIGAVNVYSSGAVGPYSYNVIGSNDQEALINWLNGHKYKIPAESRAEMQSYIAVPMLFLAMRLRGDASLF